MKRIRSSNSLDNENRRTIYEYISDNPGMCLRELSRELEMPVGTLRYHLHVLEDNNFISKSERFRRTQYFKNEFSKWSNDIRDMQSIPPISKEVYDCLMDNPPFQKQSDIADYIGIKPSSLINRVKYLEKIDLIKRIKLGKRVILIPNPDKFEVYERVWGV